MWKLHAVTSGNSSCNCLFISPALLELLHSLKSNAADFTLRVSLSLQPFISMHLNLFLEDLCRLCVPDMYKHITRHQQRASLLAVAYIFSPSRCLQVWRGTIARMRYRRMRAALVILRAYRRYKVKSYIREVNRRFKNVRAMKDYGRHVKWPTPPKVLRKFEEALRSIYNRYLLNKTF